MPFVDREQGLFGIEVASWIELVVGVVVLAGSALAPGPLAARITTMVVAAIVVVIAGHDEWVEHHAGAARITGPEAIVALAGLWMLAYGLFMFVVEASAFGVLLLAAGGVLFVAGSYNVRHTSALADARPARRRA